MMTSSSVFLLLLLLVITVSSDLEQDAEALISFITQIKLPRNSKYNWDTSQHTCAWPGVGCGPDNFSVVNLRIPGASLVGKIAPLSLGNITSLRVLSLHHNALSGPFPEDFANLSQLSQVYLHNNKFSGEFPSSLAHWTLLENLDLSNNNFSGRLPDNVASSLTKLENFTVSNNSLSGPIPSSLARFPGTSFSGNFELCGMPLSNTCNETKYPPSSLPSDSVSSDDDKKKKKNKEKLSTGVIVAIAIGSGFILLILFLCLGKKWSRVKEKKAPGVATMAAEAKASEAGTPSSKDDVTSTGNT